VGEESPKLHVHAGGDQDPSKMWFLGPTSVNTSTGSDVFAGLIVITNRDRWTMQMQMSVFCNNRPHS